MNVLFNRISFYLLLSLPCLAINTQDQEWSKIRKQEKKQQDKKIILKVLTMSGIVAAFLALARGSQKFFGTFNSVDTTNVTAKNLPVSKPTSIPRSDPNMSSPPSALQELITVLSPTGLPALSANNIFSKLIKYIVPGSVTKQTGKIRFAIQLQKAVKNFLYILKTEAIEYQQKGRYCELNVFDAESIIQSQTFDCLGSEGLTRIPYLKALRRRNV